MNWKRHPPTCTCGKCEKDRASRARQKEIAQAKMLGEGEHTPPPAPDKQKQPSTDIYSSQLYGYYTTSGMILGGGGGAGGYYDQFVQQAIQQQLMRRMGDTLPGFDLRPESDTPAPAPVTIDSIPEETDLVRGWRTYTIDTQGRIRGSRAAWETAEFVATCEYDQYADVVSHLLNGCLARGHAGCGIYSLKVGPEYLKIGRPGCPFPRFGTAILATSESHAVNVVAQCISSGVVVEHEHGYRAEKCRIEQMWLVTPMRCANGHWVKMQASRRPADNPEWHPRPLDGVFVNDIGQQITYETAYTAITPPHWTCSETPVDNPGAAYAQVLSTKYGVPCIAMPTAEFIAKLDEGSL